MDDSIALVTRRGNVGSPGDMLGKPSLTDTLSRKSKPRYYIKDLLVVQHSSLAHTNKKCPSGATGTSGGKQR